MVSTATRPVEERPRSGLRADLTVTGASAGLVALASAVAIYFDDPESPIAPNSNAPPLYAVWSPHAGAGTPFAILLAIAVITWGPALAARLRWRWLLGLGYLTAVAWTLALAMIDGWRSGFSGRLTDSHEYLHEVPGITDIGLFLRTFADRIPLAHPDAWTTHVAGHPPGATLIFVWLDRLGISGGGPAALVCVLVGCLVAVAVPVTVQALRSGELARSALPFVVLFPGAVWVGASADGMFAGLTSVGVAFLALGTRGSRWWCLPAGVLLGFGVFTSYGMLLLGLISVAVVLIARDWRALLLALPGAIAVLVSFAVAGFWWFEGYQNLVERYYQGLGGERPYAYWVWANLACLVLVVGPAVVAGLRRGVSLLPGAVRVPSSAVLPVMALGCAAICAVVLADASGLSKAEVERIWLPFAVWLLPAAGLLPEASRRWWLAGQAAVALAVNHLLWTNW
ncbi:MAG: hypothetical protein GEU98_24110 [Pseudonocardiaceae bacterium]|nr:hypothetical protein [Pseudonocardiaceae bacterium]